MNKLCMICCREFKNFKALSQHLNQSHSFILPKQYYDQYVKKEEKEGICYCGKETSFWNITHGYLKFCSCKCSNSYLEKLEKTKKIMDQLYGGNGYGSVQIRKKSESTLEKETGYKHPLQNPVIIKKLLKTMNEKYGGTGYGSLKIKKRIENTIEKRYGSKYTMQNLIIAKKVKQTHIKNGYWMSDDQLSNFELYHRRIDYYTIRSIYKKFTEKEILDRKFKKVHIDHKYSIFQGFVDGIVPWIIGSSCNLEILSESQNCKKWKKCSITREELFQLYDQKYVILKEVSSNG